MKLKGKAAGHENGFKKPILELFQNRKWKRREDGRRDEECHNLPKKNDKLNCDSPQWELPQLIRT
jgi:hypothetical protein